MYQFSGVCNAVSPLHFGEMRRQTIELCVLFRATKLLKSIKGGNVVDNVQRKIVKKDK